jgi:neutral ceramidase
MVPQFPSFARMPLWCIFTGYKHMRKGVKIAVRILVGMVILLIVAALVCLEGIDYTPYFRTPYYHETMTRLHALQLTNHAVIGPLEAGFGKVVLTPIDDAGKDKAGAAGPGLLPLAGFGGRKGRPATGVKDDVYVKAVAIRSQSSLAVLVAADALIIPREVAEIATRRAAAELGLRRDQIYFGATHTHASLGGWGEGFVAEAFAGKYQPAARLWFADRLVAAMHEALSDVKPALFGHGSFRDSAHLHNRLVGELGNVDPEFSYLYFRREDGLSAVLGSYDAHATVLSSGNMKFSGDYPGAWERAVEAGTGGLAAFFAGAVGSTSPNPGGNSPEPAEAMGQALAAPLLDQLSKTPMTNLVSLQMLGVEVSLPSIHARLTDGLRIRPWIASHLLPVKESTFVQVLRLNDTAWVSTPCDYSGELALGVKDALRSRGLQVNVTSFNGDYIGYIIPSRYYHLDGYEPRVMSFFGPTMPDYLDDLVRSLAKGVAPAQLQ